MKNCKASMTVEMSFLMPIILLLIMSSIFVIFFYHDKNILSAAAYETVVTGSTKAREKDMMEVSQLQELFGERTRRKCIFFSGCNVAAEISEKEIVLHAYAAKGRLGLSIEKRAVITEPEKTIRKIRKIKEIANGTKNNN